MNYIWGNSRRFNAYSDLMRSIFDGRVQKLTIDAGFTCPNRDGTKGTGGCTFCLNQAFNPSYCNPEKTITQQLNEGKQFHQKRYRRAKEYLAYFQAFSNTYGTPEMLEKYYYEALSVEGVTGLVIGTRPDCLTDDGLDLLKNIAQQNYVMVEFGVESVYNKTLKRINRCHTFEESIEAIERSANAGIHTGCHLIFGLPGESKDDMMQSAGIISALPLTSIKFHQLQLFKGTILAAEYMNNPQDFIHFSMEEYLTFIVEYIEHLNPRFAIERIAGETPPRYAVTEPWGPRYDQLLRKFEEFLLTNNTYQGRLF